MGSCTSNDKNIVLGTEVILEETPTTKAELTFQRRIANMTYIQKVEFLSSTELTDYLRLSGATKPQIFHEIFVFVLPEDVTSLNGICRSIVDRLRVFKENLPGVSHTYHAQIASIAHKYTLALESRISAYLNSHKLITTLQRATEVVGRILHTLLTLSDAQIKDVEKWWGTGHSHTALYNEIEAVKDLLDAPFQVLANDYVTNLLSNVTAGTH